MRVSRRTRYSLQNENSELLTISNKTQFSNKPIPSVAASVKRNRRASSTNAPLKNTNHIEAVRKALSPKRNIVKIKNSYIYGKMKVNKDQEPKRRRGRIAKAVIEKNNLKNDKIMIEIDKDEQKKSDKEDLCVEGTSSEDSFKAEDKWICILMREYRRTKKRFEKMVQINGAKVFQKSRKPLHYVTHDGSNIAPFEIKESLGKDQQLTFLRTDSNAVVQKCNVISLEKIESTPTMQYWTLTEANVIADDEYTLSHIPFLGDAIDDSQFCAELMNTFPDGIHGTKTGCGKYINDWILYYMVKSTKIILPDLDLKTIFYCVYDQFPNKASVQGLLEMYPDLQIRFEPETVEKLDQVNSYTELGANFSASNLLNSYDVLSCHKCFSYDCMMHNATVDNNYSAKKKFNKLNVCDEMNLRPCSDQCYLTINKNQMQRRNSGDQKTSAKKDFFKQQNVEVGLGTSNNISKQTDYTPQEEAIFNILCTSSEGNYCKITQVLNMCTQNKKTCRELYEYACRKTPLSPKIDLTLSPVKTKKKKCDTHRTFRAVKWASANGKVENNCMYKPCSHKGECKKENGCRCVTVANLCTKYCPCSDDCQNRFPGCRCAPGNCRTRQCQCYFASWECDPDICKSCNCDKFDGCGEPICKNVSIQRGLQKRLLVAPSQVAGWGCFAQEDIDKNEFVSEYCGEVISQAESERRGKIYDKIKCSYLFGLNDEQVVDATRVGNVIRFANHSCNPNCRAKVIVVNGDHKIGIFANRRINRGEELFFDYAYNKSQQVAFLSKELPKNFYQT